jgi:hypothetical protein
LLIVISFAPSLSYLSSSLLPVFLTRHHLCSCLLSPQSFPARVFFPSQSFSITVFSHLLISSTTLFIQVSSSVLQSLSASLSFLPYRLDLLIIFPPQSSSILIHFIRLSTFQSFLTPSSYLNLSHSTVPPQSSHCIVLSHLIDSPSHLLSPPQSFPIFSSFRISVFLHLSLFPPQSIPTSSSSSSLRLFHLRNPSSQHRPLLVVSHVLSLISFQRPLSRIALLCHLPHLIVLFRSLSQPPPPFQVNPYLASIICLTSFHLVRFLSPFCTSSSFHFVLFPPHSSSSFIRGFSEGVCTLSRVHLLVSTAGQDHQRTESVL